MAIPLALVMAGMTAAKMASDADREERSKKLQSETERYSPWTGRQGSGVQYADQAGNIAQGIGAYYGQEQALENQKLAREWVDAQKELAKNQRAAATVNSTMNVAGPVRGYEPGYEFGAGGDQGEYFRERYMGNPYGVVRGRGGY